MQLKQMLPEEPSLSHLKWHIQRATSGFIRQRIPRNGLIQMGALILSVTRIWQIILSYHRINFLDNVLFSWVKVTGNQPALKAFDDVNSMLLLELMAGKVKATFPNRQGMGGRRWMQGRQKCQQVCEHWTDGSGTRAWLLWACQEIVIQPKLLREGLAWVLGSRCFMLINHCILLDAFIRIASASTNRLVPPHSYLAALR